MFRVEYDETNDVWKLFDSAVVILNGVRPKVSIRINLYFAASLKANQCHYVTVVHLSNEEEIHFTGRLYGKVCIT